MLITDEKGFDLLVKSIEEASKHARNLLFLLVVTSIYILITAFASETNGKLKLPIIPGEVPIETFLAISPLVILSIHWYLNIYITDLNYRLTTFDELNVNCHIKIQDPRILLFPWVLTFPDRKNSTLKKYNQKILGPGSKFFNSARSIFLFIIFALGPIVLHALWIRFLGKGLTISIIPYICGNVASIKSQRL